MAPSSMHATTSPGDALAQPWAGEGLWGQGAAEHRAGQSAHC